MLTKFCNSITNQIESKWFTEKFKMAYRWQIKYSSRIILNKDVALDLDQQMNMTQALINVWLNIVQIQLNLVLKS